MLPLLVLPLIIVGGILSGVFTVTESAAIGVAYTMLFGLLSTSRGSRCKDIYDATVYSAVVSSVAGMLLGAGAIVSWILTYNRVTQTLADFLVSLTVEPDRVHAAGGRRAAHPRHADGRRADHDRARAAARADREAVTASTTCSSASCSS